MDVLAHEEDQFRAVNNHWSQVHLVHHEPSALIVPMTETGFTDVGWLNPNLPTLERTDRSLESHLINQGGPAHNDDVDVSHLGQSITGVEEGQLVPLETLDMLHHEGEVGHGLESELCLQRVQHVLKIKRLVIKVSF